MPSNKKRINVRLPEELYNDFILVDQYSKGIRSEIIETLAKKALYVGQDNRFIHDEEIIKLKDKIGLEKKLILNHREEMNTLISAFHNVIYIDNGEFVVPKEVEEFFRPSEKVKGYEIDGTDLFKLLFSMQKSAELSSQNEYLDYFISNQVTKELVNQVKREFGNKNRKFILAE